MHKSVLLEEAICALNLKSNSIVVDCTLGYAGHSSEILKHIPGGFLYAFDQDQNAIEYSKHKLEQIGNNFKIIHSNFVTLKKSLEDREVDAILYDLGVSSPQLDIEERGFSFHKDARLDMRMNQMQKLSAYEVVNQYSFEELMRIFTLYGEEKFAKPIARNIEHRRMEKPIETTLELVDLIKESVPERYKREHHPARKIFQAIRMEVNQELEVFEQSLKDALAMLRVGGRIAVITFHSLEDKICKRVFKEVSSIPDELKTMPMIPKAYLPDFKMLTSILPSKEELEENHRARSAKLRVIERMK